MYCHDRFGNPLQPYDGTGGESFNYPNDYSEDLLSSTETVFNPLVVENANQDKVGHFMILGNTGKQGFRLLRTLNVENANYYSNGDLIIDCDLEDTKVGNYNSICDAAPYTCESYGLLLASSLLQLNEGNNFEELLINSLNTFEFNNSLTSVDSSISKLINVEFSDNTTSNIKHAGYTHFNWLEHDVNINQSGFDTIQEIQSRCVDSDKKGFFYLDSLG